MATNLKINEPLLEEVKKAYGFRTKRETVDFALRLALDKKRQSKILEFAGKVDFDPTYDYKAERRRP